MAQEKTSTGTIGTPQRSPAAELIALFFNDIVGAGAPKDHGRVYVCSLANIRNDPNEPITERKVCPTSAAGLDGFVSKWDRPRRATYFCVGTIAGETRNKDAVCRSICLHGDIDFKAVIEDEPTIRMRIAELRCQPTAIVFSGHGLHLYWLLRESLGAQEYRDRIEAALRRLAEVIGSDPTVCEISRLMRLPGSHNTKNGDWIPVRNEKLDGPRYELDDLEEWLEEETSRPMLTRKAVEAVPPSLRFGETSEPAAADDDPFSARSMGYKPRVDVEAMLAGIRYPENIHDTQLRVSASLIKAGQPLEEVFEILYQATRNAPGVDPAKWNWRTEAKNLRAICEGALIKYPPEEAVLAALDTVSDATPGGVSRESSGENENVVNIGAGRARQSQPKTKSGSGLVDHIFIGEMFLSCLEQSGEALVFTEQGVLRYKCGQWHLEDDLNAWLNSRLEACVCGTTAKSNTKLINEARSWVIRRPELQRSNIPFNQHGCIPTLSGLINPRTGEVTAPAPEHYCTWQVPFEYWPKARCPHWLQMLEDVFADRQAESRALHIQILQELLGCGLIEVKAKALSRALILIGGSNYGKSGLLDVLVALFGKEKNTTGFDALEKPHGLMPFAHRRPWVLHEAFDAGKLHFSSIVKALISGEAVQINVKNGKIYDHEFTAPIFWGANVSPNFREATKAIVNRIVVLECRREFDEANPIGTALVARNLGYEKPQHLVLATEMEGVLAWAVEGLQRALARGHFILPKEAQEAAEAIRLDSNVVAGFVEDCLKFDANMMVSTADFNAAFVSWWTEHRGEDRGIPSGNTIGRAMTALGDRRVAISRDLRTMVGRYYAGIRLNRDGKRHWNNTVNSNAFAFQSRTANTTDPGGEPNVMIPGSWEEKLTIQAMRTVHEKMDDRSKDREKEIGHEGNMGHDDDDQ